MGAAVGSQQQRAVLASAMTVAQASGIVLAELALVEYQPPKLLLQSVVALGVVSVVVAARRLRKRPAEAGGLVRGRLEEYGTGLAVCLFAELCVLAALYFFGCYLAGNLVRDSGGPGEGPSQERVVAMIVGTVAVVALRWWRRTRSVAEGFNDGVRGLRRAERARAEQARRAREGGGRTGQLALQPGQVWYADVTFEEGTGSKDRPCVVLVVDPEGLGAWVAKITSQDSAARHGAVEIPMEGWDGGEKTRSWVDVRLPHFVDAHSFRRRAGTCPSRTYERDLRETRAQAHSLQRAAQARREAKPQAS